MIIMRLMGGLGNQMFQYACGRSLALRTGHELVLETGLLKRRHLTTPREFGLDAFNIAARLATRADMADGISLLGRVKRRLGVHVSATLPTIEEPSLPSAPSLFPAQFDCLCLVGYWQSEAYFAAHADVIRRDLALRAGPAARLDAALLARLAAPEAVSLHVRRGDYVADAKTNQFHGVCPLDYYRRAADHIAKQVRAPEFFVFSDDPGWVREHLQLGFPLQVVSDGRLRDFEELTLMSRCHHHIIANSSFSWWGAWLNPRPDKIVCAPRTWYADPTRDARDLVPAAWFRC
jgi:hypothetical protein